jgi:putrescine aminotransferase
MPNSTITARLNWLDMPAVVDDPSLRERYRKHLLQELEDHSYGPLAQHMRITESDLIEWRTDGLYLYTMNGEPYFDCLGAGGVFGLGFNHPDVIGAVRKQLDRSALNTRFAMCPAAGALYEKLAQWAPVGLTRSFLASSGTEAMEAAIKLARLATGKAQLIGTDFGYHGMSIATLSISGLRLWRDGTEPSVGATTVLPFNDIEAMRKAIDKNTAAVILEPVQWASGCEVARTDYLQAVRQLCDENGALLIFDEIQCGLGRTGHNWAHEIMGVVPDILCVGKILSGGVMPLAATMYTEKIYQAEVNRPLFNNSSYGGNSLACAAGFATLEVMERDNLVERSKVLGDRVGQAFDQLAVDFPTVVKGQRGVGLMRCMILTQPMLGLLVQDFVRVDHNILIASMLHIPEFVRISPPFICKDEDIEKLIAAIRSTCAKIAKMTEADVYKYYDDLRALYETFNAAQVSRS